MDLIKEMELRGNQKPLQQLLMKLTDQQINDLIDGKIDGDIYRLLRAGVVVLGVLPLFG